MTISELSERYKIDIEKLKVLEQSELIPTLEKFDDSALKQLSTVCNLYDSGLSMEDIKRFLLFKRDDEKTEQIKILNLLRRKLLDEIHKKQKSLDSLDYIIFKIKNVD